MAQDSSMSLRHLPLIVTPATTTTTTTTTTSSSSLTTTTTATAITTNATVGTNPWEHHGKNRIYRSELESSCSFVGFELDSKPSRLISDLRQLLIKGSDSLTMGAKKRSLNGLNGLVKQEECANSLLCGSENVVSDSVHSVQKVLMEKIKMEYCMKKKDNLVNIEKINRHDECCKEVEEVCLIDPGGNGLKDNDDDIIIVKEILHNNAPLKVSGAQQKKNSVQPSKTKNKETEIVSPRHCLGNKETSPLVVKLRPEIYALDHQVGVEQDGHYNLYGAPEIIEVIAMEDIWEVEDEVQPNTGTFLSPVYAVALDHSYSSPLPRCLEESFTISHEGENPQTVFISHTEEVSNDTCSESPQAGCGREEVKAESPTLGVIDAVYTLCHNYSDVSDGVSKAATTNQVCPIEAHPQGGSGSGRVNSAATTNQVCPIEARPRGGSGSGRVNSAATTNQVCPIEARPRGGSGSGRVNSAATTNQVCPIEACPRGGSGSGRVNSAATTNQVCPIEAHPQGGSGSGRVNSAATTKQVCPIEARPRGGSGRVNSATTTNQECPIEAHPRGGSGRVNSAATTNQVCPIEAHPRGGSGRVNSAATTKQVCPIEAHPQGGSGRVNSAATTKQVCPIEAHPRGGSGRVNSAATTNQVCPIEAHPRGGSGSSRVNSAATTKQVCPIEARPWGGSGRVNSAATTNQVCPNETRPQGGSGSGSVNSAATTKQVCPIEARPRSGSGRFRVNRAATTKQVCPIEAHPRGGSGSGGLSNGATINTSVYQPLSLVEEHPQDGRGKDKLNNVSTNSSVVPQPCSTTDSLPQEQNKLRPERFAADEAVRLEHFENVKESSTNIHNSQRAGKFAKKPVEEPKLSLSGNDILDVNSQKPKTAEMNDEDAGSEPCLRAPGRDNSNNNSSQRAGSQERMMIRSSIQLRKRKIYKLIEVPQRESINYDQISDIDTHYANKASSFEDDLPAIKKEKEIKKPNCFANSNEEKKAVNNIWQVLVSQLEDCMRGITTLPPAVTMYTRKRKRSLSAGRRRGSGGMTLQRHKESVGHNDSVSSAERQDSGTSQCVEGKEESSQTTHTCGENRVAVQRGKRVCFCRYNTVLPVTTRRTCCGRKRVKSVCRRNSRAASREDIVFPTDQKSLFQSLGLMDKRLYDKDVYYESLVTHRTRKVRANQIKGKDHYRMFLNNRHANGVDQNSGKVKQPLPLTFISKENLCKLSTTKSKALSKGNTLDWQDDEYITDPNFEGFSNAKSKESRSRSSSPSLKRQCNLTASVNVGDVGGSVSRSETVPSVPFCCTDTNDNFTENYSLPKTRNAKLEHSKTSGDMEECPVCEKSTDEICSLNHKVRMEPSSNGIIETHHCEVRLEICSLNHKVRMEPSSNGIPETHHCEVRLEKIDSGSLVTGEIFLKSSQTENKIDNENCYGSTLLDSQPVNKGISSAMEWEWSMEEINKEATTQSSTDEQSISNSDIMEVDNFSDGTSEDSLPNLWTIGLKKPSGICNKPTVTAASSDTVGINSHSTQDLFKDSLKHSHSRNENLDFLGFDNEPDYLRFELKTPPLTEAKEDSDSIPEGFHGRESFDGKYKLKCLEHHRHLMTLLHDPNDDVDASKELEDVSQSVATSKVSVMERSDRTKLDDQKDFKGKPLRTSPRKGGGEAQAQARLSLSTKETKPFKSSPSPTLRSSKTSEKMSTKLSDFDLTRNCRVNLTKIQLPESVLEGIKVGAEDSIISPSSSGGSSPEKLRKTAKRSEPESCVTISRFSTRQNVSRIKYSELLNLRRSLNGLYDETRPPAAYATKHARSASDEIRYKCSTCLLAFTSKSTLNSHLQTHEENAFKCTECALSFSQEIQLQSHTRLHNTASQAVFCEKCGESFSQLENLRDHVKNHLSPKSLLSCKCQPTMNDPLNFPLKDIRT